MFTIKPFTPNDYQALADIENAVFTDEFSIAQSFEEENGVQKERISYS